MRHCLLCNQWTRFQLNVHLQELFEAHEQFKSTLPEADKEFNAIMRLSQEVQRLSSSIGINNPENPYTTVNPQVRLSLCLLRTPCDWLRAATVMEFSI